MKKKGFTLIELLAVIVILAIIALIVTPIVSKLIDSAKDAANARSVEGHIKNIEYAIIHTTFNNSMDDLKKYDGETSDAIFRATATIQDGDDIYCESITLSDGSVTIASGCRKTGWNKEYTYEKGIGAYVTGTARPITNPVNPSTPEPSTPVATEGLFDENDNLLVSWDDLVNVYGLDIEKNYTDSTYNTDSASGYSVFTTNNFTGKLVIPDTVTKIGNSALRGCTGLTGITLTNNITSLGESSFRGTNIESIVIPEGIQYINFYQFEGCTNLSSVTIPNTVTRIRSEAFKDCTNLTTINIPNSVTAIDLRAFANSGLVSVIIPGSVTEYVGYYIFRDCRNLETVIFESGVKSIGKGEFQNCSALSSVTIPNTVTAIGDEAFYGSNIDTITIPNSVTSIGNNAFSYCANLTSITIPSSVKRIYKNAFSGCTDLTSVTFENQNGWFITTSTSATSGTNVDVTNPSTNATNLKTTYKGYYWKTMN